MTSAIVVFAPASAYSIQASSPHLMFYRSVPIHLNDSLIAEDMLHRFENGAQNPEGNERASSSYYRIGLSSGQSLIYR